MRRFLRTLILFVFFLVPFYMISTFLWEVFADHPFKPNLIYDPHAGFLSNRLEDLKNAKDVDILVLGSSKAYRGFDPRNFSKSNYEIFNLGSSAQKHVQTNYFLKEYLDQIKPKFIIYEVYPDTFQGEGVESAINVISSARSLNSNLLELVWEMNNVKTTNTFLNKITRKTVGIPIKLEHNDSLDKYIKGGYVEHLSLHDTIVRLPAENWIPAEKQVEKFEENLEIIENHGIPFILILTPYTKKYKNFGTIESYFREKGEFYNLDKKLEFSAKNDFYDGQHLNQNAVNKLNKEIIQIIDSTYFVGKNSIPD